MKIQALVLVSALQLVAARASDSHARRAQRLANRADADVAAATTSISTPPAAATTSFSTPAATYTTIPPLESITSGMPTRVEIQPTATYTAGATAFSGAPPLPTPFVFVKTDWPDWDHVPPVDSAEVAEWMKELDGINVPNITTTQDGTCAADPAAAADAANRGWWTCGGHTRDTDVTACPNKLDWGVSFDDGPSPYTQYLLDFLDEAKFKATFFVVGSRVVERPKVLVEEYMKGHEISVHTWSHRPLTSLTNEQIVAELGWTRKAIKAVLGVTPTTMRPPFGDIDDRVRAITLAMGMVPIMWSRTPAGGVFDTNDWRIPAGYVKGPESFETFKNILSNATTMDTGFIVLEHDLYEASVDIGVGYTLPYAIQFQPKLNLIPIGQCMKKPVTDLYLESNTNKTFPVSMNATATGGKNSAASAMDVRFAFSSTLVAAVAAVFVGLL
ncbi:carbohydrate esterase family 4 protein [Ephemerocybe angulata]|uniref:chitin deacetylase n=1 Tax=Ephemerocybe angulata TaxID=980116 RepID=A0A8H6HSX7_9AGAR|nr:carbohydrate esterase family 4 protein [Tulosesus angulatus]